MGLGALPDFPPSESPPALPGPLAVPWADPAVSGAAGTEYAMGKDCIMHGYMAKLGNPFLTQWQRRYFYLFPNRLEWRGEGESPVRRVGSTGPGWGAWGERGAGAPQRWQTLGVLGRWG